MIDLSIEIVTSKITLDFYACQHMRERWKHGRKRRGKRWKQWKDGNKYIKQVLFFHLGTLMPLIEACKYRKHKMKASPVD